MLSPEREWTFEAIGTHWWIGVYEVHDPTAWTRLQTAITERIEAFDKSYSRFRADSLVTKISQKAGTYTLPADGEVLLQTYRQLYDATDHKVTPLVGRLLSDAGYDADYSLRPTSLQPVLAWDDVMNVQGRTLVTKQPVLLDFGAAGKGYLVDILVDLLQKAGITRYCVDAGGDMRCGGLSSAVRIGLEHPQSPTQAIGVSAISEGALCGSAGSRRAWAGFNHIMNPATQSSPDHIAAVWVYSDTALWADGLTTALYFAQPEKLRQLHAFEYAIMYHNSTVTHSADFPAEFFTSEA